ncbi:hypothetical protein ACFWUZ_00085 [Streptomyces sp. NPDC058646]|uniref:hypothetical protein n=1 Tax=Streptomyces sp. NPDC058646 TaxID=3346574 RepID=UPI0036549727
MSEEAWVAVTGRETVLLLAALAVCFGGAVGFARTLPRFMLRSPQGASTADATPCRVR